MIRPLEPVVEVVALVTELPMIIVGVVSSVSIQPILVDKMASLVSRPPTLVALRWCLWQHNCRWQLPEWSLQPPDYWYRSLEQNFQPPGVGHWLPKWCLQPLLQWLWNQMGKGNHYLVLENILPNFYR